MKSNLARDHGLVLHGPDDALELISCGLGAAVFTPAELHPNFFELSNGLAGEIFQKLVNYRFQLAVILPEDHGYGDRVTELVRDHKTHPYIRFFATLDAAQQWLPNQTEIAE